MDGHLRWRDRIGAGGDCGHGDLVQQLQQAARPGLQGAACREGGQRRTGGQWTGDRGRGGQLDSDQRRGRFCGACGGGVQVVGSDWKAENGGAGAV